MKLSVSQLLELVQDSKVDHRSSNVVGKCPKCNHSEFGISIEKENHPMGCYRGKCGFTGNIYVLLRFVGKLHDYLTEGTIYSRTQDKLVNRLVVQTEDVNLDLPTITPPMGWVRVFQNEYLESRGFTKSDFEKHHVGTTNLDPKLRRDYVIFLEKEEGEIKGWVARHIWDKKRIEERNETYKRTYINKKIHRYLNSETDFSKLLGGSDELTENTTTLILVEGKFDKVGVDRLLQLDGQEEVKCCCTWKCDVSPEQLYKIQVFSKIQHIILLYDPDVVDKIKKVSLSLEDRFQTVEIGFSDSGKDPGEMNLEDLDEVLSSLYTPDRFLVSKLQVKGLQ